MKTHWTLTYVTQGGSAFQESTRTAGMDPATEAEVKGGLAGVIADAARRGPLPAIYVQDQRRGGHPTLVLLGRLSHVELTPDPDPDPDPEAQRHLELVLTEPAPGEWDPTGLLRSREDPRDYPPGY